jgi:O-antigen/teichoic acid export membrane protein
MQWRVAITWLCGYFAFWFFTPVLFKYQGPAVAGQMGMTANLVSFISFIPSMWLAPRVPLFGRLVAQRNFAELDRIFWKLTKIMIGLAVPLGIAAWVVVVLLYHYNVPLAHRLLPPLPTGLFITAQIIVVSSLAVTAYLRAHKKEPLMTLNLANAAMIATCALILGRPFGAVGVAAGYLATTALAVPLIYFIWSRLRAQWHAPQSSSES